MMRLIALIIHRLDRRPSPIGELKNPRLLGLHMNLAMERAVSSNPFPFAR